MLLSGAFLLFLIGFFHSYLGEKYILIRLFRRENLPHLLGSDGFTKSVLRFAWHLTTLAWLGFGAILYAMSLSAENLRSEILAIIGAVFGLSGLISFLFTRGKDFSWLFFFIVSAVSTYAATKS